MWVLFLLPALAGYGDAVGAHPTRNEREAHFWTNAVRMAPRTFVGDYPKIQDPDGAGQVSCLEKFKSTELSPRAPLAWHRGLAVVAREHSADMNLADDQDGGSPGSSLSHDSSDGTGFVARVGPTYPGAEIGENVAFGFNSPFRVVMTWMCSDGHRENILHEGFVELGVGQADDFWTQDFGGRPYTQRVINMGVHLPPEPSSTVTLMVDAWEPVDPVVAVLDGVAHELTLDRGVLDSGVYQIDLPTDGACHLYWFASGAERFPENGAYGYGDCEFDLPGPDWMSAASVDKLLPQADLDGDGKPDHGGGSGKSGCTQAPMSGTWLGLLALLGLRRRRA